MENRDFSRYTDEELRELLRALVLQMTDSAAGEIREEINK